MIAKVDGLFSNCLGSTSKHCPTKSRHAKACGSPWRQSFAMVEQGMAFISLRRANSIAVNYNDCHQVEEDRRGLPALVHDLMPQRHWQLRTFQGDSRVFKKMGP